MKVTSSQLYEFVGRPFSELLPYLVPNPIGFLRGFFTAEGNPSVAIERRGRPRLSTGVELANSDYQLLVFSRDSLSNLGFHPGRIRLNTAKGKRTNVGVAREAVWLFSLSRFEDAIRFSDKIGFADEEKQSKLRDAISFTEERGSFGAASEWSKHYEKQGRKWVRKDSLSISS